MMYKTEGLSKFLGGVILEKETFAQKDADGNRVCKPLLDVGIKVGVKADLGWMLMPGSFGEMTTQGLDNLHERCAAWKKDGASFVKWRCPLKIQNGGLTPTELAIGQAAEISGRYAAISQAEGLVPIVEPDVMLDGDHDIDLCKKITEKVLMATFTALQKHNVLVEGILLKTNMVTPGAKGPKVDAKVIAAKSVQAYRRTVPAAMPGIVFLSGGQSPTDATENLNEMNKIDGNPWKLSFSYSRAIQGPVLEAWQGKNEEPAQKALLKRCTLNSLAAKGKYSGEDSTAADEKSQFVENYTY
ncbi:unnamed protein product [Oikopleura dioica]|uniref:fructose-bisphosphate aldolase n=1 Tax=Oikopleura dioica TaxID=34765 RepID=E4Y6V0_OIKDI|nr:unnamed protein product [Oikopleura dioica]